MKKKTTPEKKKKKGSIPFVNVTEKKKKKLAPPTSANTNPKTPKKKRRRTTTTTTTMAFGREQKKKKKKKKKKDFSEEEEEEKGSKEGSFCCAFEEEEEEEKKQRCFRMIDVATWTHVVKMMQHATTFEREAKEDAEILANAYLWKDGRVFPMVREALTTLRAQTASEEKGRTVEALARRVSERWKTTKMKKGEEEKDANEIVLGVLETLKEEMAEAHRVGKLVKKKEKKETTDAETQKETTIDDGNEKVPLAVTMNFGAIIAQEMAAKEALWKPKDEDEEDDDDEGDEARENLSVYETRCPARRNFEMRCEVRTQCVACQDAFVRNETLMQLSLDMPSLKSANNALRHHPLEVQLREFFQKKVVEKRCEKCGADVAEETRLFVQLPRYLLVHVNRFVWMKKQDDPSVNERRKLCWRISCPKNIPIATLPKTSWHTHPPDACTSTARNKSDGVYSLRAVLAHSGEDEEGGRTLLHVRNKVIEQGGVHLKETWTTHDGNILSTSSNARLNETERFEREAYVLLYSHPDFTF